MVYRAGELDRAAAEFDADRDAVHALARAAGVERLVIPAVAVDGFPKVKSTVGRYPGCVAAYGIHPLYVRQAQESDLAVLRDWWSLMVDDPAPLAKRGYQSYAVLSLCRILYTLEHGAVASKREAAQWARGVLDSRWGPLIDRAWEGRSAPDADAPPEDVRETRAFICYALERSRAGEG